MNAIVKDTVTAIMNQAETDERFRADFEKAVGDVYKAGVAAARTVVESHPLSHDEIELVRGILRTKPAAAARRKSR